MPTYNSARYVGCAIESVLAQSEPSWELLVVDDGSSDNTRDVVKAYERADRRIKFVANDANIGAAKSRNRAIGMSGGRYVAFLDSDDMWHAEKLGCQVDFMRSRQCALSYTAYEKIDEDGSMSGRVIGAPESIDYNTLLGNAAIGCLTAMYDSRIVGRVMMPDIKKRQDHGLWLRILRQGVIAQGIDRPLAYLRVRPGSLSSNKIQASRYLWRLYRDHEMVPLGKRILKFSEYAVRSGLKYLK